MGKLYLGKRLARHEQGGGSSSAGTMWETVNLEDSFIMVLADGLGSGVKASILSTLTAKILSTMLAGEMTVEDCVETIALTLPVCKDRGIAYCTFTILQVQKYTGEVLPGPVRQPGPDPPAEGQKPGLPPAAPGDRRKGHL